MTDDPIIPIPDASVPKEARQIESFQSWLHPVMDASLNRLLQALRDSLNAGASVDSLIEKVK